MYQNRKKTSEKVKVYKKYVNVMYFLNDGPSTVPKMQKDVGM